MTENENKQISAEQSNVASNDKRGKTIVLSAGGTGGHFFPAKALAADLLARGFHVHIMTDKRGERYKDQLDPNIEVSVLSSGTMKPGLMGKIKGGLALMTGLVQAYFKLKKIKPHVVVGFGGYPSFPPLYMAQKLKVPTVLHEQNSVLGKANQMLAHKAYRIALSLPKVFGLDEEDRIRSVVTGNPVRSDIAALSHQAYKAPDSSGEGSFHILVLGGSQGAHVFADVIPAAMALIPENLRKNLKILQQCREDDIESAKKQYEEIGCADHVILKSFVDNIADELSKAHLLIGRSGASTVAEVATAGRPAIFVPYPHHADQQQKMNALTIAEKGGAWIMEEGKDFTAETLAQRLEIMMKTPQTLFEAAEKARGCGRPDAARKLGNLVTAVAEGWDQDPSILDMMKGDQA